MEGYLAEIRGFAGNFSPRGWAYCNGQLISIAQNTALFSLLGTTYGGDGRTTFALPDLRGRAPISAGTGPGLTPRNLGARGGTEYNNLTANQLASHTHSVVSGTLPVVGSATATMLVNNSAGSSSNPDGNYLGVEGGALGLYESTADGTSTLNAGAITVDTSGMAVNASSITIANAGASSAINNMQPYLVIHWIICMQGIFPSRN